jgi:TolB protein
MKADGTAQTRLTMYPADDETPAWSPDGTRIGFSSTRDGNLDIYAMHTDGTGVTRLTTNPAFDLISGW